MIRTMLAASMAFASFCEVATAATVKQVSSKKKLITVELDDEEVMEKDAVVCVFD